MPERTDVSPRGIGIGIAIIVTGIAVSFGAAAWITALSSSPPTGPSRGTPPHLSGPELETAPAQDLASFRREKQARLESYGRVDADHMHIPIERAMQILAKERAK